MKTERIPADVLVDVGPTSLVAVRAAAGANAQRISVDLSRDEAGTLTESARDAVRDALRGLGGRHALVGLPSRGISIRRFDLPAATSETIERVLALQVEQAFPVPPADLAWGYRLVDAPIGDGRQAILLAMRRETLDVWRAVFEGAGMDATFTLGALAATAALPADKGPHTLLDVGATASELISLDGSVPVAVRTLPVGAASFTPAAIGPLRSAIAGASAETGQTQRVWLASRTDGVDAAALAGALGDALGDGFEVREATDPDGADGGDASTVLRGLGAFASGTASLQPITFLGSAASKALEPSTARGPRLWPWIAVAALLLAALAAVRYVPAIRRLDQLRAEVRASEDDVAKMPDVDRELAFYEYVESKQTPAVGALAALAHIIPTEGVLETLSLRARGGVLLAVKMKSNEQNAFRKRLVKSRWFSGVRLEGTKRAKKRKIIATYTAQLTPPDEGLDAIDDELKTKAPDPKKMARGRSRRVSRPTRRPSTPKSTSKPKTSAKPVTTPPVTKAAKKPTATPKAASAPPAGPGGIAFPGSIKLPDGMTPENMPEGLREKIMEAMKNRMEGGK